MSDRIHIPGQPPPPERPTTDGPQQFIINFAIAKKGNQQRAIAEVADVTNPKKPFMVNFHRDLEVNLIQTLGPTDDSVRQEQVRAFCNQIGDVLYKRILLRI